MAEEAATGRIRLGRRSGRSGWTRLSSNRGSTTGQATTPALRRDLSRLAHAPHRIGPERDRGPASRRRRETVRRGHLGRRGPSPRPDERREPQPLGVHAGRRAPAAVAEALERLVGAAIDEIDMEEHTGEHPRIGAVDVIPFVPLGRHHDGRVRRAGPDVRAADRGPLRPAGLPVRRRGDAIRSGSSWPTSGAASTRASRRRSPRRAGEPDFGPPRCTPRPARSPSVRGRSSSPTTSTSTRRGRGARPADRPARPRVRRRPAQRSRPTASSPRAGARTAPCPGLDEPPRLHGHAAVARLGDGPRRGRDRRRRARRVRS